MLRMRLTRLSLALVGVSMTLAAAHAQPDPNDVAERCIQRMRAIAQHCGRAMNALAEHAANRIDELQDDGNDAAAERVARRAIHRINAMAEGCLREIHRTAAVCVRVLRRLDAPDVLIDAVRTAAERAGRHVRMARRHAVGVVLEALNG